jgi:hypothetical protein
MLLEDQQVTRDDSDEEVDELVRTVNPGRFWDQPGD